ncbi:HTH-type dhaKLM operon transcriptional activator DhaS [Pelotomaculum sp. FP]|uniref:TetR/AcrR family transcriptional regulator C-terminal domain-containing protein n=1 Tax=Pelotomaculum sp. FP TaxID=261474 RepID=UPI001066760F|nr:TetR/AcrR family transcriptional regulator C-terminal domain-containing protein [Pelotomaculum sp. FP]TEB16389.1 HTH-type dhaKLM operon transcriptional activator DhaS [Pelotomaculum sp. FP]
MSKNSHTCVLLAESLKCFCKKRSLSAITVSDLIKDCGINRSTFYYHFADKYDLINWIFKNDVESKFHSPDRSSWQGNTLRLLQTFSRDRDFYIQALNISGANNLKQYLFDAKFRCFSNLINTCLGPDGIMPDTRDFIASFYAHAFTEMHYQHLIQGMKESPEHLLKYYVYIIEPGLFNTLDNCATKNRLYAADHAV